MTDDIPEFVVEGEVEVLDAPTRVTTKDERLWGMLTHLSSLGGYVLGIFWWVPPLVIWLVKRDESRFLDHQGREALNFQLTMFLGILLSIPLAFVFIGIFTMIGISIYALVYTIIAGLKANEGVWYRYPFSIKFVSRAPDPDA